MKKKHIVTLGIIGIIVAGLSTPKLVNAFWPFDKPEDKSQATLPTQAPAWGKRHLNLSAEDIQVREAYRADHFEERLQAISDFFGIDLEEIRSRLDSGEKPHDIAEDSDKTIEEWREFRLETRTEHMREMGLSEEEIQSKLEWMQENGHRGQGPRKGMGMRKGI